MRHARALPLMLTLLAAGLLGQAGAAFATSQRTFVASIGNDANACSLTAPCRSFAAAIAKTSTDGEVIVLDSAGYGPVTITKPVSVTAPPGIYAGVSVASGTGIDVNVGAGIVTLTGLTINGLLSGAVGIEFQSGGILRLNRVTVSRFTSRGLVANLATTVGVTIEDSAFLDNAGIALDLSTSSGELEVDIRRSRFENNHIGASLADNVIGTIENTSFVESQVGAYLQAINAGAINKVTVRNCTIARNTDGLILGTPGAATTAIEVRDSEIRDNTGTGAIVQGGIAHFSNNSIAHNGFGVNLNGTAISFGDNLVYGNGGEESFSSTLSKH